MARWTSLRKEMSFAPPNSAPASGSASRPRNIVGASWLRRDDSNMPFRLFDSAFEFKPRLAGAHYSHFLARPEVGLGGTRRAATSGDERGRMQRRNRRAGCLSSIRSTRTGQTASSLRKANRLRSRFGGGRSDGSFQLEDDLDGRVHRREAGGARLPDFVVLPARARVVDE